MKKIFIRSPYFIEINESGQTGSKVELYIWNKEDIEPTTPTYTLSKVIPSANITKNSYNISNYCKEYIEQIKPLHSVSVQEEDVFNWCFCKVKRYKLVGSTYTLLNTETFVCLNGYTNYSDGYNKYNSDDVVLLYNQDIKMYLRDYNTNYVNCFFEAGDYDIDNGTTVTPFTVTDASMYKIPINSNLTQINQDGVGTVKEIISETLCEPKYTPIICTYINRYGGWQYLTFFKANMQSIETNSKQFQLLPNDINYNIYKGQTFSFNQQGKQKISCNTGWVDENYFELMQDLLFSEVVLLNNKPVIVKSQSADYKTHLKDKNINYTIDFEYNYGLINDVI